MTSELLTTDVLVIGAGAAGIRAAIEARREGAETLLVCAGTFGRGGSTFHPSSPTRGLQAATGKNDDTPQRHAQEILDVGLGEADPNLADILAREAPHRLDDLIEMGVPFSPQRVPGCFSSTPRASVIDNLKGFAAACARQLDTLGVRILEHTTIVALSVLDRRVTGAVGLREDGAILTFSAGAVVLAAGGGAGAFTHSLAPHTQSGSSIALAHEAGARLKNLEFFQIMLGTLDGEFLDTGLLRQRAALTGPDGADLLALYKTGEQRDRGLLDRTRHMPFSTRDDSMWIDIAIARTRGPVTLSAEEKIFHVAPFAHAFNGGIVIDARAETTVEGLFACGEASTGMHGADRIGGTMLSATQVFGARAGKYAAQKARRSPRPSAPPKFVCPAGPLAAPDLHASQKNIRATLTADALVIRTPGRLAAASAAIGRILHDLDGSGPVLPRDRTLYYNTLHLARFADLLIRAEQSRPTSKGPHYLEAPAVT